MWGVLLLWLPCLIAVQFDTAGRKFNEIGSSTLTVTTDAVCVDLTAHAKSQGGRSGSRLRTRPHSSELSPSGRGCGATLHGPRSQAIPPSFLPHTALPSLQLQTRTHPCPWTVP